MQINQSNHNTNQPIETKQRCIVRRIGFFSPDDDDDQSNAHSSSNANALTPAYGSDVASFANVRSAEAHFTDLLAHADTGAASSTRVASGNTAASEECVYMLSYDNEDVFHL